MRPLIDRLRPLLVAAALLVVPLAAQADALAALQAFVRDARTGSAEFTQTVTTPDGSRRRTSSGTFEFSRPNRFRFSYTAPFEQLIVADGQRLWVYDPDLNQVISRKQSSALSATPAALLAGAQIERDFKLSAEPARDGLEWVKAVPKQADGGFESLRIGFRNGELAAVDNHRQPGPAFLAAVPRAQAQPALARRPMGVHGAQGR
jgi:outer membrane lipoprotein carrier protein